MKRFIVILVEGRQKTRAQLTSSLDAAMVLGSFWVASSTHRHKRYLIREEG